MACTEWLEKISAHVDGELDVNETAELQNHMQSCEVCSQEAARLLTSTGQLLQAFGSVEAPAEFTSRVMTQVTRIANEETDSWWSRFFRGLTFG